jgi:hypothetical protein
VLLVSHQRGQAFYSRLVTDRVHPPVSSPELPVGACVRFPHLLPSILPPIFQERCKAHQFGRDDEAVTKDGSYVPKWTVKRNTQYALASPEEKKLFEWVRPLISWTLLYATPRSTEVP